MGTRSRIGIQLKDGSILSSYHHWDGYPEWLGRILTTHYNSREQAAELIDGGDMSCAWTKDRWTGKQLSPYVTEQTEAEEYLTNGEEYGYIFENGEWKCYDTKDWSDTYKEQISIPEGALAV